MQLFQCKTRPNGVDMTRSFLEENFIAIGWGKTGPLDRLDKDGIRERLAEAYDYEGQEQKLRANLGTVNAFVNTMFPGDLCLVTDGERVHVCKVKEYMHDFERELHMRSVEWIGSVFRSDLNVEVQSLLRNQTSVTKFKHSIEDAELDFLLTTAPSNNNRISNSLLDKALDVLIEELNSGDRERRVKAAIEIVRFFKK